MEKVLICPVCGAPLARQGGSYVCPGRHTFDRARQGYTNLLLRPAGQHGDNREMILARRAFLESGAYAPLKDAICAAARLGPKDGIPIFFSSSTHPSTSGSSGATTA